MTFFTRIYLDGKHSDTHDILMRAVSALLIADGRDADIRDVRTNFTPKGVKLFPHNTYTTEAETYKTVPGQGLPGIVTVKNDPKGKIPAFEDNDFPNYSIPEHTYSITYNTSYGYTGDAGGSAGLHALAIILLEEVLPEGVSIISYMNDSTFESHEEVNKESLAKFMPNYADAIDYWYDEVAVPAIERAQDLQYDRP